MSVEATDPASDDGPEQILDVPPPTRGRAFATGWWGRGWVRALEDTALDGRQLPAGRRLARSGAVGAVVVRSGRATAVVRDRDGTGHRADVLVQRLGDAQWQRLLTEAATEAGQLAALLDGELPVRWAEDAESVGAGLLPGIGDLEAACACGEWDHCAHTAALSYQLGRLLDHEPLLLLLLRGRDANRVVRDLRAHRSAATETPGQPPSGVPAGTAWARAVPPLPPVPPVPGTPGAEAPQLAEPPPPAGGGADSLGFLLADSAARAAELLARALRTDHATSPPEQPLSRWQDAARMAAGGLLPDTVAGRLARACERTRADLTAAGLAWWYGGADGLAVLEDDDRPPVDDPTDAPAEGYTTRGALPDPETVLAAAWAPTHRPRLRRSGNRWTVAGEGVQLRRGGDGRWWPYRRDGGRWWPAGPPAAGPAAALVAARAPGPSGDTTAGHPG